MSCYYYKTIAVLAVLLSVQIMPSSLLAQPSLVTYIRPTDDGGEYVYPHISPDGERLYVVNRAYENEELLVFDTSTHDLLGSVALENPGTLGDMHVTSDDRIYIVAGYMVYQIDPDAMSIVASIATPWSFWPADIEVTTDETRAYLASWEDVYIVDLNPLSWVDTTPLAAGEVTGLVAMNPQWGDDWYYAFKGILTTDEDGLIVLTDTMFKTISGLGTTTDYSALPLDTHTFAPDPRIDDWSPSETTQVYPAQDLQHLIVHDLGAIIDTTTMKIDSFLPETELQFWNPYGGAISPDGSTYYSVGWSGQNTETTYKGHHLLMTRMSDYSIVDLDGDFLNNGYTGIKLPEGNGWDGMGSYGEVGVVSSLDGEKLFVTAGSRGILEVTLVDEINNNSSAISPNRGGQGGEISVTIFGEYAAGVSVSLEKTGEDTIAGTNIVIFDNGSLETLFDLTTASLGKYDVVVSMAGEDDKVFTEGFTVEEAVYQPTLEVIADRYFLATDAARARIIVTNYSNVDILDPVVSLRMPNGVRYKLTLPSIVDGGGTQIDEDWETAVTDEPDAIWISRLKGSKSYEFEIVLTGPEGVPPDKWNIHLASSLDLIKFTEPDELITESKKEKHIRLLNVICDFGNTMFDIAKTSAKVANINSTDPNTRTTVTGIVKDEAIKRGTGRIKKMITDTVITLAGGPVGVIYGVFSGISSCYNFASNVLGLDALFANDPNEKLSFTGNNGYIKGHEALRYQIFFENKSEATAAAETVIITDQLHINLDWSTFELQNTSHPDEIDVNIDQSTGLMTITFENIDLPPNQTPPEGEGMLEFTISPKPDLEDKDTIENQASIIFDLNDPIVTSNVVHTVDQSPPDASVEPLEPKCDAAGCTISWSATDDGVGVEYYDVYLSVNNKEYELWQNNTNELSVDYVGDIGDEISFFAVSRDKLGNAQTMKTTADTSTSLVDSNEVPTTDGGVDDGGVDDSGVGNSKSSDSCGCITAGQNGHQNLLNLLMALF